MKEDETLVDFNVCLSAIDNNFFALGEKKSDVKLVRKILRSIPNRFNKNVIVVGESEDISTIKVDEMIGLLLTFEVAINEKSEKKNKGTSL